MPETETYLYCMLILWKRFQLIRWCEPWLLHLKASCLKQPPKGFLPK